MDSNPWSYAIMAKELEREGSYEDIPNPILLGIYFTAVVCDYKGVLKY